MKRIILVVLCLFLAVPFQVFALEPVALTGTPQILFSEIMANPLDESTGEFIELYNASDSPVDLNGWVLNDLVDVKDTVKDYTGTFDVGVAGTTVAPHAFALVVDPDYAGQYNDLIEARADLATLVILTVDDPTLGNGLGNSSDTIALTSADGLYHITHSWASDTANGFSWSGYMLSTPSEVWKKSVQPEGASPAFGNNMSPDAALEKSSETGEAPLEVHFDASDSTDPEGLPLSFSLIFGDETSSLAQTSPSFVHTYAEPGTYTATLTVTDSENASSTAQETVTVTPKVVVVPCSLKVSEILPNPAGDDASSEFIEIQNTGTLPCNLLGHTLDDTDGGSSPYKLPEQTLSPGAFVAFYSNTTHITLNNSADSARVLDASNNVIASVSYTDSKESQSYAWSGSVYAWTTTLTPNAQNVMSIVETPQDDPSGTGNTTEQDDTLELSTIHDAKKLQDDDSVMVEGYIIAKPGTLSSQYFYIHDGTSGLQVYSSKKLFPSLRVGQKVRVTGTLSKTENLTRILTHAKEDVQILTSTKSIHANKKKTGSIKTSDEGELVSVAGTIEKKLGTSVVINDGSGPLTISFRDGSGLKASSVTTNKPASIQGIVTVSNGQVAVLPRGSGDVVTAASLTQLKGTLPKTGADIVSLFLVTLLVSLVMFACHQLFLAIRSRTFVSASLKKGGKNLAGAISVESLRTERSAGLILPTNKS